MHKHYRLMALVLVVAMLLTAVVPALAAPEVLGAVASVTVAAPTKAAPTCVKAGGTFDATFSTDGGGQTDPALNWGQTKYWMGGTIALGSEDKLALPITDKTVSLTVPAGTADGPYDFKIEAKSTGQDAWVANDPLLTESAIIVDSTAPVVPAGTITAPAAGDYLPFGVAYDIKWNAAAIKEMNVKALTLQLLVDGNLTATIAQNAPNTGSFTWVPNVVTTNATIRLLVSDCAGAQASDQTGAFTIWNADNTVPNVAVTAPAPNANTWIGAAYTVKADASDAESGITKVEFFYSTDGATWKSIGIDTSGPAPYTYVWKPMGIADGTKVWIMATATNGAGAYSSAVSPVDPNWAKVDVTAPSVTLTAPAEGAWISNAGGNYKLVATASDAGSATNALDPKTGIAQVTFWFSKDGTNWGTALCTVTVAPFECTWTDAAYNGAAWFKAEATNNAGGKANDVNAVTVDSILPAGTPVLTAPDGGEGWLIGSTQNITWKKGLITDANLLANPVTLKLSSDGGTTWDVIASGLADTGTYAWKVGGLPSNQSLIRIEYADKAGNVAADASNAAFTIFGQDSTPPTVSITAPAAGTWTNKAPMVVVAAKDDESAIAKVEFYYSNTSPTAWVKFGEVTKSPWQFQLPSLPDGAVQLVAVATNGMGLQTTSAVVTFYIDTTPATVGFAQPLLGVKVSGDAYEVIATATDAGAGVKNVALYVGEKGKACTDPTMKWTLLGTPTAVPYKATWNSAAVADGFYCFRAVATDNMGYITDYRQTNEVENVVDISLQVGWNLISSPVLPYNTDIKSVMATLVSHGSVKQVATFVWSSGKLVQQTWLPAAGGTLKTFVDGQGYWVEMNKADTLSISGRVLGAPPSPLPAYGVSAGWNLIGFTAQDPATPMWYSDYLAEVLGVAAQLYSYDPNIDLYVNRWYTDLHAGEGFWLATTGAGTIYP